MSGREALGELGKRPTHAGEQITRKHSSHRLERKGCGWMLGQGRREANETGTEAGRTGRKDFDGLCLVY